MSLFDPILSIASSWTEIKTLTEHALGVERDTLHVIAGVCLQLFAAAILRTTLQNPWPWVLVFAAAFANEWHDIAIQPWPSPAMQFGEGLKDFLLTMFLPTLLLLVARYAPGLLISKSALTKADAETG